MEHGDGSIDGDATAVQAGKGGSIPTPPLQVSHQKTVREAAAVGGILPIGLTFPVDIKLARVGSVSYSEAKKIILQYEYLGTMPSGFRCAYGIFWQGYCGGVVVFGSPNPMQIAKSVFGGKWMDETMQLHRGACVWWAHPHSASLLISRALKELAKTRKWRAVVAFSDPAAGEIGTVYQASNWYYCGWTAKRPDYVGSDGKRKVGCFQVAGLSRMARPRKRRYLKLIGDGTKESLSCLRWPLLKYEKRVGDWGSPP